MVPYEMPPVGGLEVTGGAARCFELAFPSRAAITKIVVQQTDGTLMNFTAAFFNANAPCGGQGQSDSDTLDRGTGKVGADCFRVTPDLAGTAGLLTYFSDKDGHGGGFDFVGQEKDDPSARLGSPRRIYMRITPGGNGTARFSVVLAGRIWK